ncbi:MAG: HAD family hydrolase [Phycisphaerae bacterium]|nr:HAD family hydrolase [Phycisphaerae bacterium]MCZ2401046.1 HAD family hydrolase [Phycisphaerae bacterium]
MDRPRLLILDLDGTLVDSLRDIAEATNECLDLLALPTRPLSDFRFLVGEGFPALGRRAVDESHQHLVPRLVDLARARYRTRFLRHTVPFPGVREMVASLRTAGIRLGVVSNKPHDLTTRIVNAFWPGAVFDAVQGYLREEWRKPNPHHALEMCRTLDVPPPDSWFIGDTATDILTGLRAGMRAVGVSWGFRPRSELEQAGAHTVVDTPAALAALAGCRAAR